ncbi:MAG: energy-coupling factor transporter transmembrane protein EcfT [Polyangiaceae bacterium]|nr:energy-coupling factor transporter transmembrane protein EcfT [Polyangiaceae bacterium]
MSERYQHILVLLLSVALLVFVFATPAQWHFVAWVGSFALARILAPTLRRGLGNFRRWLIALVVLAVLGAALGAKDKDSAIVIFGLTLSPSGALAATTMIARAFGLVGLSRSVMALYPPARAIRRLTGKRFKRVGEVLLIAFNLLPSLIDALRQGYADIAIRNPGWWRMPWRLFNTIVFAIEHAANLAENIAQDLASSTDHKEST